MPAAVFAQMSSDVDDRVTRARSEASTAYRLAAGANARRNSANLIVESWLSKRAKPVALRPGRASESTTPHSTGSHTLLKTIGTVAVARIAATVASLPKLQSNSTPWRN